MKHRAGSSSHLPSPVGRQKAGGRGRQSARDLVREAAERLRAILQTAVEGIITIDERGIIESLNPTAERIFGYGAAELIGKNVSVLMPSPYRQQHDAYIANYLRTGRGRIIGIGREVVGQRKDRAVFPMDLAVGEVKLKDRRLFTGFVRDITERKRLEQEILEISNREQRRIGQDLHDGLCQELAGIELLAQVLEQDLQKSSKRDAAQAGRIAEHVRRAIAHTRMLARGLSPVELEAHGLMSALHELARHTEELFDISCRFQCPAPVLVRDNDVATHVYRIAQEAINNVIKHGRATRVTISLTAKGASATLRIADNGRGFQNPEPGHTGMGLRIMKYRSNVIGGTLAVEPVNGGGTSVACIFQPGL
ncbi:MAG: PAS domain S-box protein [Verrucomicrobia subdivision 3 bacterium]|nr:PAS domain S-box protein [Limisphaerales bacterium]